MVAVDVENAKDPGDLVQIVRRIQVLDPSALERPRLEDLIQVGALLIRAKSLIRHGSFGAWVTQHFGYGPQWRSQLQKLARLGSSGAIDNARDWATKSLHPLANANSVEDVLALCKSFAAATAPEGEHSNRCRTRVDRRMELANLRFENAILRSVLFELLCQECRAGTDIYDAVDHNEICDPSEEC